MKFEVHMQSANPPPASKTAAGYQSGYQRHPKSASGASKSPGEAGSAKPAAGGAEARPPSTRKEKRQRSAPDSRPRACFRCHDPTHGVFQCPNIANAQEAKTLYEQHTGRKVVRNVRVGTVCRNDADEKKHVKRLPISAKVNGIVDCTVTLDSGASVTLISPVLFEKLENASDGLIKRALQVPGRYGGVGGNGVLVHE